MPSLISNPKSGCIKNANFNWESESKLVQGVFTPRGFSSLGTFSYNFIPPYCGLYCSLPYSQDRMRNTYSHTHTHAHTLTHTHAEPRSHRAGETDGWEKSFTRCCWFCSPEKKNPVSRVSAAAPRRGSASVLGKSWKNGLLSTFYSPGRLANVPLSSLKRPHSIFMPQRHLLFCLKLSRGRAYAELQHKTH